MFDINIKKKEGDILDVSPFFYLIKIRHHHPNLPLFFKI